MSDSNKQEKDVKLKLAGASYMLGDVAMMMAGRARKDPHVVSSAATWFAGGVGAALYGNPDPDMQLRILSNRLERHLKKKGVTIPTDVRAQNELLKQDSLWDTIQEFLFEHPSEILNTSYAIGAGMLLDGSIRKIHAKEATLFPASLTKEGFGRVSKNFWTGALILAGALSGLLLKEDPDAKKKAENGNIIDNVVAFATEKPLRISGSLYMGGNLFLAAKAMEDFSERKGLYNAAKIKPHNFSFTQLACYVVANSLLLMSPRNQVDKKGFSETQVGQLQEAAASIIAAQPKEVQTNLIKDMSEFMSKQAGVTLKPEEIEKTLTHHLTTVTTMTPAERRFTARLALREAAEQTSQHSL